jgi:fatty acid amide hydrolase 2
MAEAAETTFAELLGEGRPFRPLLELGRFALGRSPHTLPALALALIEGIPALLSRRARAALLLRETLRRELIERIGDGVLLYPPYPTPAPRHGEPLWPPFQWVYAAVFNVTELPVTQVPLGLDDQGLPLGVQVAGGPAADHRTIAVALELERRFGGWTAPRAFD